MVVRAALALAGLLLLAGCAGEEDAPGKPAPAPSPPVSSSGDATPSGLRSGLAALWAGDHPSAEERTTAACFADALLERRSVEQLAEAGLVDADGEVVADVPLLAPSVAEEWVRAQFACTDFYAESARAQLAATKGRVDAAAYTTCLRTAITEEQVVDAVVASLSGGFDDPDVAALSAAQLECSRDATPGG